MFDHFFAYFSALCMFSYYIKINQRKDPLFSVDTDKAFPNRYQVQTFENAESVSNIMLVVDTCTG